MVEVFVLLVPPVLLLALVVLSLEPHAHRHMDPMAEKALESVLDPHYIDYYCIIRTVNMSVALGTRFNCFKVLEYSWGKKI